MNWNFTPFIYLQLHRRPDSTALLPYGNVWCSLFSHTYNIYIDPTSVQICILCDMSLSHSGLKCGQLYNILLILSSIGLLLQYNCAEIVIYDLLVKTLAYPFHSDISFPSKRVSCSGWQCDTKMWESELCRPIFNSYFKNYVACSILYGPSIPVARAPSHIIHIIELWWSSRG